jgi:3',5'-cyclic AMP phosphodiesterase CpdA
MFDRVPGAPPTDRRIVLHCSDLHFGRGFRQEPAAKLLEQAQRLSPAAVVVSGDLTMRARAGQFLAAREFLRQLPAPLVVIPGNHDIPLYHVLLRLTNPFRNYRRHIEDLNAAPLDLGTVAIFAMNTINPWMHQKGRIRESQLHRLREWAAGTGAGKWRVAVVHQQFANTADNRRPGVYRRPENLLREFSDAGVHLVLHGHVHASGVKTAGEFFPGSGLPTVVSAAGTASSGRLRGGAERVYQFNLVEFGTDGFSITPYNWNPSMRDFAAGEPKAFERSMFPGFPPSVQGGRECQS